MEHSATTEIPAYLVSMSPQQTIPTCTNPSCAWFETVLSKWCLATKSSALSN